MARTLLLYVLLLVVALVKSTDTRINSLRFISTSSVMLVLATCVWAVGECLFWYWPQGKHQFSGPLAVQYAAPMSDWKVYVEELSPGLTGVDI